MFGPPLKHDILANYIRLDHEAEITRDLIDISIVENIILSWAIQSWQIAELVMSPSWSFTITSVH